jgi:hypothetical protein
MRSTPIGYGQETKHAVLDNYCFSIAETCREDNLFTEWIVDCFALGTIPIFWGAPNIDRFFNAKGILQFDTVDRLYKILARSRADWYAKLPEAYHNLNRW